jgi:hypothetical protein
MMKQPDDRERWERRSEHASQALERLLRIILGGLAAAVFAGGVFALVAMSSTSEGRGSRLIVAVAAVLLLGWVHTQFGRLALRRRPLWMSGPGESAYRRYLLRSAALLLLSALVLVGLAVLLP